VQEAGGYTTGIPEGNRVYGKSKFFCNNTGFYGRVAILEALLIDDVIREMIIRKASIDEIKKYAIEKCGMKTLRDDAFLKVRQELTTLNEALRITTEE
jgi:type IV pilus assembly protein PilB